MDKNSKHLESSEGVDQNRYSNIYGLSSADPWHRYNGKNWRHGDEVTYGGYSTNYVIASQ